MLIFRLVQQHQFLRFLLTGGLNTLFAYSMFALFTYLGCHYTLACLLTTVLGICFNYKTMGKLVFTDTTNALFSRFCLVYLFSYFINISLLKINSYYITNIYLNSATILPIMTIITYSLNKHFVFREINYETH